MQADRLIVGAISEPLSISDEELWIETPTNHRGRDEIVIAIHVRSLGNVEELPSSA